MEIALEIKLLAIFICWDTDNDDDDDDAAAAAAATAAADDDDDDDPLISRLTE